MARVEVGEMETRRKEHRGGRGVQPGEKVSNRGLRVAK